LRVMACGGIKRSGSAASSSGRVYQVRQRIFSVRLFI
jgi:hypothetical protein